MSKESSPVSGTHGFDSDALEEWVAETAEQKGVSKQQLLDEILSSYWVLEELSGVVTDSEVTAESKQSEAQPAVENSDDQHSETDQESETDHSGPSSAVEFSELKSELQGLQAAIEELSQEQDESQDIGPEKTEVSSLEGQLEDLSSAVVERRTETDEDIETLSQQVDSLAEQVDSLTERVTTIESQLDDGVAVAELKSAVEQTASAQTELERRIESEFDSIEQVLQHLLDTTDNIEYRLGAVSESRQETLRPIRERHAVQEELMELKQEALRHDIKKAVCDTCDQPIDLGLLETTTCPGCERRFTGIKKGGWLPFSKTKLQTTDRPRESQNRQQLSNSGNTTAGGRDSY